MTTPDSTSRDASDPGDRERAGDRARRFFDGLWNQGDYWKLETSAFEQARYARLMEILGDQRYRARSRSGAGRARSRGCWPACPGHVVALDVSPAAIDRARAQGAGGNVEFRVANVMETAPEEEGAWDLIVMNETVYYIGWLYSFFDVSWLAHRLFTATAGGGRFLLANTFGDTAGYLLLPPVIHAYRDLCVNVGFPLEREEVFHGTKDDTPLDVLISLLQRPPVLIEQ